MLQNGLYWSFYCCSSILDLCTNHQDTMSPSLCTIYKCQGETSRASFKWTNHQQTVSTDTPGVDPHPTWETKLHLPVPLWDKKESNESSRQLFFFNHLPFSLWKQKKSQKKRICVGGKQTKDFGSEWKYVLMSLHVRIHFIWHVQCSPRIYSPVLPFFQYLHQSIKKGY